MSRAWCCSPPTSASTARYWPGFAHARGRYLITLDADLQNPPEETARLVAELDAGHDYVGTIREQRQDVAWRRWASRFMNRLRERTTRIRITDQGCMFRGYARSIVDAINQCSENNTFVPALAYTFASNPTEIDVRHEDRSAGESKYSMYQLIKLNFDLMTGFSTVPMQLFSALGFGVSLLSLLFGVGLVRAPPARPAPRRPSRACSRCSRSPSC